MARAMGNGSGAAPRLGLKPLRGADGSGSGSNPGRVVRKVEAAGTAAGAGGKPASRVGCRSGRVRECAAILDVLRVCGALRGEAALERKWMLERIVAMLTRMTRGNGEIKEEAVEYEYECEYDEGGRGEPVGAPNAARPRR